jgi:hypothetical protein
MAVRYVHLGRHQLTACAVVHVLTSQKPADVGIALAAAAGPGRTRRLLIAGTASDPGCELVGAAEGIHIGADFNEQHGRADQVGAGQDW